MRRSRSRVKIIAISFNTHGTGLTRVMHSIMPRLADRHEIHYLGIGYSGETIRDRGLTDSSDQFERRRCLRGLSRRRD